MDSAHLPQTFRNGVDYLYYRWIADKIRTSADPVLNNRIEYLEFLTSMALKLRLLSTIVNEVMVKDNKKIVVFYHCPEVAKMKKLVLEQES